MRNRGAGLQQSDIRRHRMGWSRMVSVPEFREGKRIINALEREVGVNRGDGSSSSSADGVAHDAIIDRVIASIRPSPPLEVISARVEAEVLAARAIVPPAMSGGLGIVRSKMLEPSVRQQLAELGSSVPKMTALRAALAPLDAYSARTVARRGKKIVGLNKRETGLKPDQLDRETRNRAANSGRPSGVLAADEVILRVAIYHPTRCHRTHEFLVLGSQSLLELKRSIDSVADAMLEGQSGFNRSYFFIEGVFYDDFEPGERPLSARIIDWTRDERRSASFPPLKSRPMHASRFRDLKLRLGSHYHYCHAENERHMLMFTEMRFAHASDMQDTAMYPRLVFRNKETRKKCSACKTLYAGKVVYGHFLTLSNPSFFCSACFDSFHFDQKGEPLYQGVKVLPYFHDEANK